MRTIKKLFWCEQNKYYYYYYHHSIWIVHTFESIHVVWFVLNIWQKSFQKKNKGVRKQHKNSTFFSFQDILERQFEDCRAYWSATCLSRSPTCRRPTTCQSTSTRTRHPAQQHLHITLVSIRGIMAMMLVTWCTAFGQHAFDVTGISVVLQCTLSQTSFLTQL